jgi:cytochrome c5
LKRDQKFFDMYSLVIGVLAAIGLGFFVLAMKMSERTQGAFTSNAEEYLAEVSRRLAPFGEVNLPGDDLSAEVAQSTDAAMPTPVAATLTGPQVYNEACIACHGSGIGGAPMITNPEAWQERIAQGPDILRQHAIEGFTGSAGYMPPKGGRLDLSDDEIYGAVDYMISEAENN